MESSVGKTSNLYEKPLPPIEPKHLEKEATAFGRVKASKKDSSPKRLPRLNLKNFSIKKGISALKHTSRYTHNEAEFKYSGLSSKSRSSTPVLDVSSETASATTVTPVSDSSIKQQLRIRKVSPVPRIPSFLTMLPERIAYHILSLLPIPDLCRCSQVCASWYGMANDNSVWFQHCLDQGWTSVNERHASQFSSNNDVSAMNDGSQTDLGGLQWKWIYASHVLANRNWRIGKFSIREIGIKSSVEVPLLPEPKPVDTPPSSTEGSTEGSTESFVLSITSPTGNKPRQLSVFQVSSSKEFNLPKMMKVSRVDSAHKDAIYCVWMDGETIVTASKDGSIKVWTFQGGKPLIEMESPLPPGTNVAVVSFGIMSSRVIGGMADGSLAIWNLITGELLCWLSNEHLDGISCVKVAESATGNTIVTASFDGTCRVYELETLIEESAKSSKSVFVSRRGRFTIRLSKIFKEHRRGVLALCTQVQGQSSRFLSAGADAIIYGWSTSTDELTRLQGHVDTITCLEATERYIFSGSLDKTVRVWNGFTGACLYEIAGHNEWIKSLSVFEPCKGVIRLLSSGFDGSIRSWTISNKSAQSGHRLYLPHPADLQKVTPMSIAQNEFCLLAGDQLGRVYLFDFESSPL